MDLKVPLDRLKYFRLNHLSLCLAPLTEDNFQRQCCSVIFILNTSQETLLIEVWQARIYSQDLDFLALGVIYDYPSVLL